MIPATVLGRFVLSTKILGKHHVHDAVLTLVRTVRVIWDIVRHLKACLKSQFGGTEESRSRDTVHAVNSGRGVQRRTNNV